MSSALVIAHISDLHVSTFGDVLQHRSSVVRRGARPFKEGAERYEALWTEAGWRVLRDRQARRERLTLVDPQGYAHPIPSRRTDRAAGTAAVIDRAAGTAAVIDRSAVLEAPVQDEALQRAVRRARVLEARRAVTLAAAPPDEAALAVLLAETPRNTNLRLLAAAKGVAAERPDIVLISGDLTDDGVGYELIEAALRPYAEAGRLLAIPGNHDLYLLPLASSARPRPTQQSKEAAWEGFAARLGLTLSEYGGWVRELPEAQTIVVGLDSCARPQPRFYRQNGHIGGAQLAWLRDVAGTPAWRAARHRVVALHHHVIRLGHGVGRRMPTEIGMRLDDAVAMASVLNEIGCTFVLHGHRHISEERHPAGCNFRLLAAPSLTLGCKSGDGPSFWRLELSDRSHVTRVRLPAPGGEAADPYAYVAGDAEAEEGMEAEEEEGAAL